MTPEEFVARYGITGGAVAVTDDERQGDWFTRTWELVFTINGTRGGRRLWQSFHGDAAYAIPPLTPTGAVQVLLGQVLADPRLLHFLVPSVWRESIAVDPLPPDEVMELREWMGSAMFADFLTITPSGVDSTGRRAR